MLLENFTYPQDTRVRNEAESLVAAGHEVTVLAPRGPGQRAQERVRGVFVRRYRTVWAGHSRWSYALEYGIAHTQLLARSLRALAGGSTTVHFHGPPDTLAVAGIVARLTRRKVVYDMHDSGPELFEAKFGRSSAQRVLRLAQRMATRCADHVIVTNQTQHELATAHRGRSDRRVTIVRNGPRIAEFPPPSPGRPGALGAPRLIYVGTLDVQDGVLELPSLLSEPGLARAHLTVVGDGGAREEIALRCRQAGVTERVTFTGRIAHERVSAAIAASDIGIDPAPDTKLNHGSTMIKVAEYMAAGRPTVAYDLRETRRTGGEAIVYAPCGNAQAFAESIAVLAGDGERRLRLGKLARERALQADVGPLRAGAA